MQGCSYKTVWNSCHRDLFDLKTWSLQTHKVYASYIQVQKKNEKKLGRKHQPIKHLLNRVFIRESHIPFSPFINDLAASIHFKFQPNPSAIPSIIFRNACQKQKRKKREEPKRILKQMLVVVLPRSTNTRARRRKKIKLYIRIYLPV